jgi:hypothetical protein
LHRQFVLLPVFPAQIDATGSGGATDPVSSRHRFAEPYADEGALVR